MTLSIGTTLGPYRIDEALAAGGMGEVYRATDTRLDRVVAVKVLPERLAEHDEIRERFEREARAASSLNHPHICAVYDVGHDAGLDYVVLEYLEGETLAARLTRGPLPLDLVLEYAAEIADALDKAHRHGIVHRDLKPSNLILNSDGAHLLDFGIAKWQPSAGGLAPTEAPTTTNLTEHGKVLGTFQYMAPEQLEGRKTDARTDIFGLGVLIYEMATGRKAFVGDTQASLVTAILTVDPPPMRSIRPDVPDSLDRLVATCLAKDPEDRWQSAHDLLLQLDWVKGGARPDVMPSKAARNDRRLWVIGAVAAALLAAILLMTIKLSAGWMSSATASDVMRFVVGPDAGSNVTSISDPEISPDGRRLAFVASSTRAGGRTLFVRSLDSVSATQLEGAAGAANPFWSPRGDEIAFFAGGALRTVPAGGGKSQIVCSSFEGTGTWGRDGTILFTNGSASGVIFRVPATGGQPQPVTRLDGSRHEVVHLWPRFLPDGDRFLFLALGFSAAAADHGDGIYLASLKSRSRTLVSAEPSRPGYAPDGYLLFARNGHLLAQRFDESRGQVHGEALDVADQVMSFRANGRAEFSVSRNGVLAYRAGAATTRLVWLDRQGRDLGTLGVPADYGRFRLSPDGSRVVVEVADSQTGSSDLWATELTGGPSRQLTSNAADETNATFSPDGRSIAFASDREGPPDIFVMPAQGPESNDAGARPVLRGPAIQNPNDWSPDGKWLLYEELDPKLGWNILLLPVSGSGPVQPKPLVATAANEYGGRFSPDGRAIAYVSDESGRPEVYVRGIEGSTPAIRISKDGGSRPRWHPDGRELFFISDRVLMSVKVSFAADGRPSASDAERLFEIGPADVTHYEVARDGKRFLVNMPINATHTGPFIVTLNWSKALSAPSSRRRQ